MQNETLEEARLGTRAQHRQHAMARNSALAFQAGTRCSPHYAPRASRCLSNAALSCSAPIPSARQLRKGFVVPGSEWVSPH